jgi:hypothetical protein
VDNVLVKVGLSRLSNFAPSVIGHTPEVLHFSHLHFLESSLSATWIIGNIVCLSIRVHGYNAGAGRSGRKVDCVLQFSRSWLQQSGSGTSRRAVRLCVRTFGHTTKSSVCMSEYVRKAGRKVEMLEQVSANFQEWSKAGHPSGIRGERDNASPRSR